MNFSEISTYYDCVTPGAFTSVDKRAENISNLVLKRTNYTVPAIYSLKTFDVLTMDKIFYDSLPLTYYASYDDLLNWYEETLTPSKNPRLRQYKTVDATDQGAMLYKISGTNLFSVTSKNYVTVALKINGINFIASISYKDDEIIPIDPDDHEIEELFNYYDVTTRWTYANTTQLNPDPGSGTELDLSNGTGTAAVFTRKTGVDNSWPITYTAPFSRIFNSLQDSDAWYDSADSDCFIVDGRIYYYDDVNFPITFYYPSTSIEALTMYYDAQNSGN